MRKIHNEKKKRAKAIGNNNKKKHSLVDILATSDGKYYIL